MANVENIFDSLIDIVLTSDLGHDITTLEMAIFDAVDKIEMELHYSTPYKANIYIYIYI